MFAKWHFILYYFVETQETTSRQTIFKNSCDYTLKGLFTQVRSRLNSLVWISILKMFIGSKPNFLKKKKKKNFFYPPQKSHSFNYALSENARYFLLGNSWK